MKKGKIHTKKEDSQIKCNLSYSYTTNIPPKKEDAETLALIALGFIPVMTLEIETPKKD